MKSKVKKSACLLLAALTMLPLTGCWSYRGMSEMTIVSGMAIDKNPENGNFIVTVEVVDTSKPMKNEGLSGKTLQSEGLTIFDAVRNAKRRLSNKLYFGHNLVAIISQEVARSADIISTIDWLLRDSECRETMCMVISQEETAGECLKSGGIDQQLAAHSLHQIITGDNKVTGATMNVELYELYEICNTPGKSLAIPALRRIKVGDKEENEISGLALFKGGRLIGFLSPEDTKYFLFATDNFGEGVIPFYDKGYQPTSSTGRENDTEAPRGTLEIQESSTKFTIKTEGGRLKILIQLKVIAVLAEIQESYERLSDDKLETIKAETEEALNKDITAVIKKIQTEFKSDVLGFGALIYQRNYPLWKELEADWDKQFPQLEVEVRSDINIINTALLSWS